MQIFKYMGDNFNFNGFQLLRAQGSLAVAGYLFL